MAANGHKAQHKAKAKVEESPIVLTFCRRQRLLEVCQAGLSLPNRGRL